MESFSEDTKQCIIAPSKKEIRKVKEKKERVKRVVTTTNRWKFTQDDLAIENQYEVIRNPKHESYRFILQQMRMKAQSYKTQDLEKGKYDESRFICVDDIIRKLVDSGLACFYCKNPVHVLYEYVRDPRQWTLERLDNSIGHTLENVVISCLSCNLRRRCMNYEKYIFTKQMQVVKSDDNPQN
jgi:hypothetical protein